MCLGFCSRQDIREVWEQRELHPTDMKRLDLSQGTLYAVERRMHSLLCSAASPATCCKVINTTEMTYLPSPPQAIHQGEAHNCCRQKQRKAARVESIQCRDLQAMSHMMSP